jgi:Zn-dependent peptidase ImmA (M78 family)/DNA-binding XRE family transcriptional regulator
MFQRKRLTLARERRGLAGFELASKSGITAVTISRLESGQTKNPDEATVSKLARALDYPVGFFWKEGDVEELNLETVSFRSLKKMSAKERNSALWAGTLGLEIYDWIDANYKLQPPDLPDLSRQNDPEGAARMLRQHWNLGDRPIGNVLKLFESRGIRVLSLEEQTRNVDAYSFWRNDKPFIFLNTYKTPEHSIFDCGHELGHLAFHRHAGPKAAKSAEVEANNFASAFLMPEHDVLANFPMRLITVNMIIIAKKRWKVSAMALTVRLHQLEILSDWQFRSFCIELGKLGYRTTEKIGIEREKSVLWQKILTDLWLRKMTKADIGKILHLPHDEVEKLIFRLAGENPYLSPSQKNSLKLVSDNSAA